MHHRFIKKFKIKLALLAGFIFIAFSASAQLYHKTETLTRQQGLSDNRITCVFKDKTGYIWIGTKSGLNRYDGHDFTVFNPGNGNSISNEIINAITEDNGGNIWVATMNGLNCYNPKQKQWRNYFASGKEESKTIPNPIVWSCFADKDNRIWILTDRYGPSVLEKDRTTFRHFGWRQFVHELRPDLKGKYFSAIKMIADGDDIYAGTTIGIFKMNKHSGAFTWLGEANRRDVLDMQYDAENKRVFMTTGGNEIFYYDAVAKNYKQLQPEPLAFPSVSFLSVMNNHTWIGFPGGLLLADKNSGKIVLQKHISNIPASIPDGGVNTVYHDNTGIAWVATNNGLAKYDGNRLMTSFLPLISKQGKPSANPMGAVYYDEVSDSYFVCSIETGEVFIVNTVTGKIISRSTDDRGRKFESCNAIKAGRNNELWLLTANHVYRYNRQSNQFILFSTPNGDSEVVFRDMAEDDEGNYWFAAFHSPLYFFDSKKKIFTAPGDTSQFNGISKVNSLLYDEAHHSVWAGTFNHGLYRFDLSAKKFTLYTESVAAPHYSYLNLINDLYQDNNGRVWVATHSGGLFYYSAGQSYENSFHQLSMKEGLSSNNIYAITGNDSLLWAMSGKNITVLNNNTAKIFEELNDDRILSFTSFISDEHLPHYIDIDKKRNELLVAAGGGIMIHKIDGVVVKADFPLLLSGLSVNGEMIADSNWLYKTKTGFRYPLREMKINFAALHYSLSSSVVYEYKLTGYEDEWKSSVNINEVVYQNLQPGSYTFQLRAKDHSGNFSASQASFSFEVIPPFWKTWWFRSLIAVFISLMVFAWINRLRRKVWMEKKLNHFATSLYGQNTLDEIAWNISGNCTDELNFDSVSVYQYDETKNSLTPKAKEVKGEKNSKHSFNATPLAVKGSLFEQAVRTMKPVRLTVKDNSIVSKLVVPVKVDDKLYAMIEAGHAGKNYFKSYHEQLLVKLAEICAAKISKYNIEERLRSKIARDLHDEMGSTLTSINIMSKVAMQQENGNPVNQHLEKIKDNSSRMMESMSDMVWAINPANDTFEMVALRMKEFAAELLEPVSINYFFREEGEIDKTVLNAEQRKDIYLVFKEALNNAVKYSIATEIDIVLKRENGFVLMRVTDNGNGFDVSKTYSGNGLKNMQVRAEQIGAELNIVSIPGTGTTVSLQAPVT
jgi:signal transduction histidine kinase/ligand-binding sensor domain-containing protein